MRAGDSSGAQSRPHAETEEALRNLKSERPEIKVRFDKYVHSSVSPHLNCRQRIGAENKR